MAARYITDENGTRVGVLLDLAAYEALLQGRGSPDLLLGLSTSELQALAESHLSTTAQSRLDQLLDLNRQGPLTPMQTIELDGLVDQIDALNLLKTRARYTLRQRASPTNG